MTSYTIIKAEPGTMLLYTEGDLGLCSVAVVAWAVKWDETENWIRPITSFDINDCRGSKHYLSLSFQTDQGDDAPF